MSASSGAPAAVQPSDRWEPDDFERAMWHDAKPGAYRGPVMADGDADRAGEWLGRRVMHEPSHATGRIVGRNERGWYWVEVALTPREAPEPRLMDASTLIVLTPRLAAFLASQRALVEASLAPYGDCRAPKPRPAEKMCSKCGAVKPGADFNRHRKSGDGLSSECRACEQARKRRSYQRRVAMQAVG
jgi:hypothetical protein